MSAKTKYIARQPKLAVIHSNMLIEHCLDNVHARASVTAEHVHPIFKRLVNLMREYDCWELAQTWLDMSTFKHMFRLAISTSSFVGETTKHSAGHPPRHVHRCNILIND